MKKRFFLLGVGLILTTLSLYAQVGINDNGASPNPNAMLDVDVSSNDKGILIPRLSTTERTSMSLSSSDEGLTVYDETTHGFWFWDGSAWQELGSGGATGDYWSLTGNAGTTDGVNFLGTTDDVPLTFKVNNQLAGKINSGGYTFLGYEAGLNNTAANSTFVGYHAGYLNTSGTENTALGYTALRSNSTGGYNTAIGSIALYRNETGENNTAVGRAAIQNNVTGSDNTAVGYGALFNNTSDKNTAVGFAALFYNYNATDNIGIGWAAMRNNKYGSYNISIGDLSMNSNVAGSYGIAIGHEAMYNINNSTTNWDNTNIAIGYQAMYGSSDASQNTGVDNTIIGYQAGYSMKDGVGNTSVGMQALYTNASGQGNTAVGSNALYNNDANANTGIGYFSLYSNTTGYGNTGLGTASIFRNTTGTHNTGIGGYTLYYNTTGESNTAVGFDALHSNTDKNYNTALGVNALKNAQAEKNTAVGFAAGYQLLDTLTDGNTLLGYYAGGNYQYGESNTAIGYAALYGYNWGNVKDTVGSWNVAIGRYAMFFPPGDKNVAVGMYAFSMGNKGDGNVAIGAFAEPYVSNHPNYAIMIGYNAEANEDYSIAIGAYSKATQPNSMVLGSINGVNGATANTNVCITTQNPDTGANLTLGPMDGSDEGAQITWLPAGSNTSTWRTDVNGNDFRLFSYYDGVNNFKIFNFYSGKVTDLRLDGTGYGLNWISTSDRRVKSNFKDVDYGLGTLMKIKPLRYDEYYVDYKTDGSFEISNTKFSTIGFVAQDLYNIVPEAVYKPKDETKQLWGINYDKLTPVIVKAIQEQQKIIENQRRTIEFLKQEIKALKDRIDGFRVGNN